MIYCAKDLLIKHFGDIISKKTPAQIIEEYYSNKGEQISSKEIQKMEKNYRQHEPDQFLVMYDAIRDKSKTEK